MPLFDVTETRTSTLIWVIEAKDAETAKLRMQFPYTGYPGMLVEILEDDSEAEYEVEDHKE